MTEDFTLKIEDDTKRTPEPRLFRTSGMYRVIVPLDPERTRPHSWSNPRYYQEVWVDGGRYTGERLRQIRSDGKHR